MDDVRYDRSICRCGGEYYPGENGENTCCGEIEIDSLRAQLTELTRQKEDLDTWAGEVKSLIKDIEQLSRLPDREMGCDCIGSVAHKYLSLPIPGSAERIRQEAREEILKEIVSKLRLVVEPPYYGFENPNTFDQGVDYCIDIVESFCP